MKKNRYGFIMIAVLSACIISSCSGEKPDRIHKGNEILHIPETTPVQETTKDDVKYDAKDMAVVINVDTDNKQIVLKSLQDGEKYMLTYSGACDVTDKYGDIMAMSRVDRGEIVEAYYINTDNKLTRLHISDEAFEYKKVTDFKFNSEKKIITVKDTKYTYDENLVITSEGNDIDISEIADVDILTVKGNGKKVDSIIVTSGHGYIKLGNIDYFQGGIIEIGRKQMMLITEDMYITAPEGTYNITATIDGKGGTKEITVKRNEEIRLNLTDFQEEAMRYGSYSFDITPEDAILKIDGEKKDYTGLIELPYGEYDIEVTADGYESFSTTIQVDSVFDSLTIDLTEIVKGEDETTTETEEEKYLIYVDAPKKTQVYFDGKYMGVAPISFEKKTGSHIITLRRSGYETKMYTFDISSDNQDVHYVLPDLTKKKG